LVGRVNGSGGSDHTLNYDSASYGYDALCELPGAIAYDANGNTTSKTDSTGTTTFSWDYDNRLTSATLPGSGGTVSYRYDPLGRRIEKISPTTTSIFAYDGDNLVEETNAGGTAIARYSQGSNIDEPLAMLRSGVISYYEADGLGSLTSLSSATGALANTYTYDSFGNVVASSGSLVNSFRYTGREFDTETNLQFSRARYYDLATGRFLGEDPLKFFGRDTNFYRYVWNRSPNLVDSRGLLGVGYSLGAGGFAGGGPGVGGTASIGGLFFGHIQDSGGYMSVGGFAGAIAAKIISFLRTDVRSRITEPTDWKNDKVANTCSQQGGNCDQTCAPFVPKYSPGKPQFHW
jgi:RHS repeat-associated protein